MISRSTRSARARVPNDEGLAWTTKHATSHHAGHARTSAHGKCIKCNHANVSPLSSSPSSLSSSSSSLQPVRDRLGLLFSKDAPPQRVAHGATVELGGSQWQACVESECLILSMARRTNDKKERTGSSDRGRVLAAVGLARQRGGRTEASVEMAALPVGLKGQRAGAVRFSVWCSSERRASVCL